MFRKEEGKEKAGLTRHHRVGALGEDRAGKDRAVTRRSAAMDK